MKVNKKNSELRQVVIVTHEKFHIDEAVAILLLIHFGGRIGIKVIDVEFVGESNIDIDGGKIYLGVGNSEFDEHVFNGDTKNSGQSTASLVAEKLQVEEFEYLKLVKYAHSNDLHGATKMTELGNLLKEKFNLGFTESKVWNFTGGVLLRKLNSFLRQDEFKKIAREIKGGAIEKEEISRASNFNFSFEKKSIKRFVLKKHFSVNDVIAVKAMQIYGKKFLINPDKPERVRVEFVDPRNYKSRKGDLVIGFGDSPFGKFPALKMFNVLNVNKDGYFKLLFNLVNNLNKSQGYHPWELQGLLIDRFLDEENDFYGNFIFAMKEINVFLRKQKRFQDAKREIKSGFLNGKSKILSAKNSRKIGIFQSDNKMISGVAFSEFNCDTVIVKNSLGHVFIQTRSYGKKDGRRRSNLSSVIFKLRLKEMLKNGYAYENIDKHILSVEGFISACPEWYYHKPVQAILNGGNTHSAVKPTQLSLNTIINIVVKELK